MWEAVAARYLTPARRGRRLRHLADYFLGRWAGKLKPTALPGLRLLLSDRKVAAPGGPARAPVTLCSLLVLAQAPPQPLWFAPGVANVRKLQELPHHLLHAGLWEELRQEVIGKQRCGRHFQTDELDCGAPQATRTGWTASSGSVGRPV